MHVWMVDAFMCTCMRVDGIHGTGCYAYRCISMHVGAYRCMSMHSMCVSKPRLWHREHVPSPDQPLDIGHLPSVCPSHPPILPPSHPSSLSHPRDTHSPRTGSKRQTRASHWHADRRRACAELPGRLATAIILVVVVVVAVAVVMPCCPCSCGSGCGCGCGCRCGRSAHAVWPIWACSGSLCSCRLVLLRQLWLQPCLARLCAPGSLTYALCRQQQER
ncbi:hypothetical protein BC831DRAFT_124966 [Entophlyctis helioformis]|nr:hypothetical protein BC831DRAFT_124966 [Entophlyctis helioformis]